MPFFFTGFCSLTITLEEAIAKCLLRAYSEFAIVGPRGFISGRWRMLGVLPGFCMDDWVLPLFRSNEGDKIVLVELIDDLVNGRIVERNPRYPERYNAQRMFGYEAIQGHLWNIWNGIVFPTTDPADVWRMEHVYEKTLDRRELVYPKEKPTWEALSEEANQRAAENQKLRAEDERKREEYFKSIENAERD